jgi:hypothetical protein
MRFLRTDKHAPGPSDVARKILRQRRLSGPHLLSGTPEDLTVLRYFSIRSVT